MPFYHTPYTSYHPIATLHLISHALLPHTIYYLSPYCYSSPYISLALPSVLSTPYIFASNLSCCYSSTYCIQYNNALFPHYILLYKIYPISTLHLYRMSCYHTPYLYFVLNLPNCYSSTNFSVATSPFIRFYLLPQLFPDLICCNTCVSLRCHIWSKLLACPISCHHLFKICPLLQLATQRTVTTLQTLTSLLTVPTPMLLPHNTSRYNILTVPTPMLLPHNTSRYNLLTVPTPMLLPHNTSRYNLFYQYYLYSISVWSAAPSGNTVPIFEPGTEAGITTLTTRPPYI